ncbi:MarR family winged helix-turn-helix transcriptional regulator [Haloprofundus salinisoli]|uniref:MarR family winged helix-turn-helix transcriptional regulator n=1 Tax=Haloprofundus salinisoli TaxID=2876193 RepID=UPI00295E308E|nr:MarR family winged helix-turn-helix transcriptional regulator [Haloprofundus salinisoli]
MTSTLPGDTVAVESLYTVTTYDSPWLATSEYDTASAKTSGRRIGSPFPFSPDCIPSRLARYHDADNKRELPPMAQSTRNASNFGDLTPSAKLVHMVLQQESPLTQGELIDRTELSPRTVRNALNRLESAKLVNKDICLEDARKRVYSLQSPN